ncbi:MAG: filamentous hemagglutinin family protein [Pseudomonadota bacterium]|nr:filamentous hemagglutinin family protein [Pseudomonadota bacterium]
MNQTSQRAIIDWKSFNISGDGEVKFIQPGTTASVLNRIYSADPSIIQGKLSGNGQVLLINQNGILFDRGSQINVQSLLASTLNMSNAQYNTGALTTGGLAKPALEGGYDSAGNTLKDSDGKVVSLKPDGTALGSIGIGTSGLAAAAAPTLTTPSGGSILIFAPRIDNKAGLITSPDGQVILAAGAKAYLALADAADPTLRGFSVEIEASNGKSVNLTDMVRNAGVITADRGNVTLAGLAINQQGRISANTAIQANGSVFLRARTLGGTQAGTVTFVAGSVTQVLPDANDKSTLPDSQSFADRRGEIRVDARTIASSGTLLAPGGKIALSASGAIPTVVTDDTGVITTVTDPLEARVYLDSGSVTSVAGNWADVPFADNLLTFKVTSNELKDSPDQKSGILKGATVTVDLRKGSPLLDLSGYVAARARTVAQKTTTGGELDIVSAGSLIQRTGATLDASGGGYRYGAGTATTSLLLGNDGRTYNISTASKQRTYTQLVDTFTRTDSRWGQTELFTGLTYGIGQAEAAYVEGKAGGTIHLQSASGLVLDGTLAGGVTVGPNQLTSAPRGAALTIGAFNANESQFDESQRIGNVSLVQRATPTLRAGFGVNSNLSAAQTDNVTLAAEQLFGAAATGGSPVFVQTGFDSVEINSNGRIDVPEGARVVGTPGSTLLLRAPQIDVAGSVTMPAGNITLQPVATVSPISEELSLDKNRVTVRGTAVLSTAGVWINNASLDGSFVGDPLPSGRLNVALDGTLTTTSMLTGGRLTIATNADRKSSTLLERGAVLDVGGGASLSSGKKITAGDGGTLSIANGLSTSMTSDWLQADLWGLSPGNGGKLTLTMPRAVLAAADANGTLPSNTTRLGSDLFSDHGFSSVTVNTIQGIAIDADTQITLRQSNRVIDSLRATSLATGGDLRNVSTVALLPDAQRQAVNLTLSTSGFREFQGLATLAMAEGSSIVADPKASVSMTAVDGLSVGGRITAPGGNVSLSLKAPDTGAPDLALGSSAAISVAGTFVSRPSNDGLVQGTVIGGGTVTIAASQAGVKLEAGSSIDVSGITQVVQSLGSESGSPVVAQAVDGNAGSLVVRSQGATELKSTLHAASGSAQGAGGAFALELNARDTELTAPAERRIVVTQETVASSPVADPAFVDAALSIDALQAAGFQKLRLQSENRIELRGDVDIGFARGVRLDAPLIDVTGNGYASVHGASVAIGQSRDPRSTDASPFNLVPQGAAPALPTRAGTGLLSVQADTIDLFGSFTLNGISETRFFSNGDIRMTGRNVTAASAAGDHVFGAQVGSLTTSGDITFDAAQVYPSTRTDFTISVIDQPANTPVTGGSILIASNGKTAGDVYSAGGRLAFVADTIVQGGTVKAPLGAIELHALSNLELSPGSVTSVSADGLTVPFGSTLAGISWRYQDNLASGTPNLLTTTSADGKRIELTGRKIDVSAGATVDLSGGGEVQAREFVPGIGGSKDTLVQPNTYAIIPKSKLSSMPVDTDLAAAQDIGFGFQTARYDTSVYDQLHIGSGAIVPEGDYVLLPARYALLPDAYLIQLQTGSVYTNLKAGQTTQLSNGQTVVAGYRTAGGTTIRESSTVGVLVRPGSVATRESDYTLTASSYFTELAANGRTAAPRVPLDAGHLAIGNTAIASTEALTLAGSFNTAPGVSLTVAGLTGRVAEVDVSAERIAVVDHLGASGIDAGFLQIEGRALSALGGSLLLGGQRSVVGDASQITTGASQIVVANSAAGALKAPELLLAATDSIEVRSGSVLTGSGSLSGEPATSIKTEAGGALMRLSSGAQASVDRGTAVDNTHGEIRIADGATLTADRSLLLDATLTTQSQGKLSVGKGGDVSLASSQVSLGETAGIAGIASGLVLSNADLAGLAELDALVIKGYLGIDLYGNAKVGSATLGTLTLDSAAIRGNAGSAAPAAVIAAREVRLTHTGTQAVAEATASAGSLSVEAQRIVVGAGAQKIGGYSSVAMNASSEVVAQGTGSLAVAGDWTVRTPKVGVAAGALQTWRAADIRDGAEPVYSALKLDSSAGAAGTSTDSAAGGRLSVEARSITVATAVQAHSGSIALVAKGTGSDDGVVLASGALLDASGISKDFHGKVVTADAGRVSLSAAAGKVSLAAGSQIDVAASAQGGNAGSLQIAAAALELGGQLNAAAAAGAVGGRATLDLGTLADFSALNTALSTGGFTEAIDLRLRSGDLSVAATDVVKTRELQLAADAGRIDVSGTLDASSARGSGSVSLWANSGLALAAGSKVIATGTSTSVAADAAASHGGRVRLATAGGSLDFDAASTIDVSPGAKGNTGTVTFEVSRDDTNTAGATQLAGTVLGRSGGHGTAAEVVLEAKRTYTVTGEVLDTDIATYAADHVAFMTGADATSRLGSLKGDAGAAATASLHGATEVRSVGDLNLAQAWNLGSEAWLTDGKAGTLTLRAAGNLILSSALGMHDDNLIDGQTWNIRLVGGADLAAANPMATLAPDASGLGSVLLQGNNAKVRTGTGTIEVAAATDFVMDSVKSVIYTAGRVGAPDAANVPATPDTEDSPGTPGINYDRWAAAGGSISIKAGRDAIGTSDEWITEWLRRPRTTTSSTAAEWWAYRPNFQQGIGTLGGGDIRIEAGHDVNQLSAMLPTTGRSVVTGTGDAAVRQLDVQGGGNLRVQAGNDVIGGSYLVSRGAGRIDAGGSVGGTTPTQLYLMGVSSGDVPAQAEISVASGNGVALQSVNNPTVLAQVISNGRGPSFGSGPTSVLSYFTYSPDSAVQLLAKSGDVVVGSEMAGGRSLGKGSPTLIDTTTAGAYPSTLLASALDGDVALGSTRPIVTYPSLTAQVALLASGSLVDPNLTVSDLSPAAVTDVVSPILGNRTLSGESLVAAGSASRIVERPDFAGYRFDFQALTGDVGGTGANASSLSLPAAGRVRAGRDIANVGLTLQNLNATDVSEVRADNGDVAPAGLEIRGPGTLLIQAGRNVDAGTSAIIAGSSNLGGIIATGSNSNPNLLNSDAAHLTLIAGVKGDIDLTRFKATYEDLIALNGQSDRILAFYRALNGDTDRSGVLGATGVQDLVSRDKTYAPYVDLVTRYPGVLKAYQAAEKLGTLPLGTSAEATQAAALYTLLNSETDASKIANAKGVADLVQGTQGASAYSAYVALDKKFPRVFADYRARRGRGAQPEGLTPIILSDALAEVTAKAVPADSIGTGNIYTFQSSIQTYGNGRQPDASCTGQCTGQGDIDLWAPGGSIIAGLTTPTVGTTIGVVTNGGGAIRSVVGKDFTINQGKVLTAQGGDILIYSSAGSVDAGRGAKTSISTPPPTRTPITVDGVVVGYVYTIPASSSGSGIQTLSSDPDGIGPRVASAAGSIYLFAPAGAIDAGEAGIRSGGNIVINAQTVLNASNIASTGTSVGVPVATSGSLASSVASSGAANTSKAGEDAAAAAGNAARAAAASEGLQKPSILTVEVLGFGDKNCKEQQKDCFAK